MRNNDIIIMYVIIFKSSIRCMTVCDTLTPDKRNIMTLAVSIELEHFVLRKLAHLNLKFYFSIQ